MENLSPEVLSRPFSEWQLNVVTLYLVVQILGRAYSAIASGGGLVSIWNRLIFGTNPKSSSVPAKLSALLIAGLVLSLCGCAINRQTATSTATNPTNGVVTVTTVKSSVLAFGDVKNAVTQTKATAGKTLSAGAQGVNEETTSGAAATLGQIIGEAVKAAK